MYCLILVWQLELVGLFASCIYNNKEAELLVVQLATWLQHVDVLCLQPDLIFYFEAY